MPMHPANWAKYKVGVTILLLISLFVSGISLPFKLALAVKEDDWLEVIQTDTGYFINSITPNGNLSFRFEFHDKELSTVAFVNNTGEYAVEYYLPVEIWEYEDANGNGYFDSSYMEWLSGEASETVFAYYKNFWFSRITTITTLGDDMGNTVCEWSVEGTAGLAYPWLESGEEVLVPIKYTFHYFPLNGSLKTDFGIENFAANNTSSRLFIEFAMRYTSVRDEDVKLMMDGEMVDANSIDRPRKVSSTTILLVANNSVKGFFDFGGRCEIGNLTVNPIGVITPWTERGVQVFPPTYAYNTTIGIQLSYPHVDGNLTHDPTFGLVTQNQMIPSQKPSESNHEPLLKLPLIAGITAFAAVTITAVILKRKRKLQ
ncbi:MAG: hypothetical protein QXU45_05610 [Candidatus Bathyarchaeia archaeon]